MSSDKESSGEIDSLMRKLLEPVGFEVHPFLVGWYNNLCGKAFQLPYPSDTLAYVVISAPDMYDKAFKPWLRTTEVLSTSDPLDQCMTSYFRKIEDELADFAPIGMQDFELHANHRPKVLVQTAGSVSGACAFYQKSDIAEPPWGEKPRIFGCSIHPKYGGWFAYRGVVIFTTTLASGLQQHDPPDVLTSDEDKISVLNLFNSVGEDWRTGAWRNVSKPIERYSNEQHHYFVTPPKDRMALLQQIRDS